MENGLFLAIIFTFCQIFLPFGRGITAYKITFAYKYRQ